MKFDDLHQKFLSLSKAVSVLDKEEKDVVNSDSGISNEEVMMHKVSLSFFGFQVANNTTFNPKTDATSTPLAVRQERREEDELKKEESTVYHPGYAHMYPGYPPFAGYPPHPYLGYPGFPAPYNPPPPPSSDQKMPPGPSTSDHPGYPPMPHAMAPYPYPFPPSSADPKMAPFGFPYPPFYPHHMPPAMIKKEAAEKK